MSFTKSVTVPPSSVVSYAPIQTRCIYKPRVQSARTFITHKSEKVPPVGRKNGLKRRSLWLGNLLGRSKKIGLWLPLTWQQCGHPDRRRVTGHPVRLGCAPRRPSFVEMAYRKSDNPQKRADPLGVGGKHWIAKPMYALAARPAVRSPWSCAGIVPERSGESGTYRGHGFGLNWTHEHEPLGSFSHSASGR